jgi:adenylate kinase family enzyme
MVTGEVSDYAGDLMQSDTLKANEDYQWEVMKQFIENGQTLQYTPLFREYNDRISAMKSMFKGTVFFRIPRTTENLDYLREHQQNI